MIAAQVDVFYRRVVRDFIGNLAKKEELVRELEQQDIFLNQIEESMLQKLQEPTQLFRRLTSTHNEIEKEMITRYATHEELLYHDKKNREPSHSNSQPPSLISQEEHQDDLDSYSDNLSQHHKHLSEDSPQRSISHSINSEKRPLSSDLSLSDLSEFDAEYGDAVKRLRENAKIHILGTYECNSKKHSFKHDITEVALENVFIKVEGVAKEILLKKLHCLSQKRVHRE